MLEMKERTGAAVMLITHDLGVIAETAQRVVVMYAGRKVEEAPVRALFARPRHPYTRGLMTSIPKLNRGMAGVSRAARLTEIPGVVPSLIGLGRGGTFAPRRLHAPERSDGWGHHARGHRRRAARSGRGVPGSTTPAGDFPGSVCVAESTDDRGRKRRRAVAQLRDCRRRRAHRARRETVRAGGTS